MSHIIRIEKKLFEGEYIDLTLIQLKEMIDELEHQNTTDKYEVNTTCLCEHIEFVVDEDEDLEITRLFY